MSYGDVQATWAREIWTTLEAAGVEHVVVSPGSRSTPLVLGAERSSVRTHVIVDERTAGFFALGIARLRGAPVALLCSSGTAGAHYLPAVIEAWEAGHPLIVLTADRPPELHGVGASQTTEQTSFFGRHSVFAAVLGTPSEAPERLASLRSVVARAATLATERRGPVHLDVPLRKPFEPTSDRTSAERGLQVFSGERRLSADALSMLRGHIARAQSGWVVVGPCALSHEEAEAARRFCARTGFALLAEPGSNLRDGVATTTCGESFLRADGFELALRRAPTIPNLVVQIGRSPVSKRLHDALEAARGSFEHLVIADHGWHDASRSATAVARAPIGPTLTSLTAELSAREPSDLVRRFVERCDHSWDHVLAALLEGEDRASEPAALRTLVASLPDGGSLFVGNSQPIRDLNEFCVALPENVGVVTQRGVAGIDGNIASLLGMSAVSRVPVTAVIGDVAFFHDAGALLEQGAATAPTVLLVLNNGGGRIFEALPIAQAPDVSDGTLERLWLTPRSPAITAVAAAYGARGASTAYLSELASLLTEAYERDGLTVIEVVADPTLTAQIRTRARDASAAND